MATTESYLRDLMGHVLQVLYMVFLGVLIAVFCGLGVDTFYPAPKMPDYPVALTKAGETGAEFNAEQRKIQAEYDAKSTEFQKELKVYNRNASLVIIGLAIVALILSLTVLVRWEVIANGVLLGGIFTMAYSIILGVSTEDSRYRFLLVTVGVVVTLILGYIKFIRTHEEKVKA